MQNPVRSFINNLASRLGPHAMSVTILQPNFQAFSSCLWEELLDNLVLLLQPHSKGRARRHRQAHLSYLLASLALSRAQPMFLSSSFLDYHLPYPLHSTPHQRQWSRHCRDETQENVHYYRGLCILALHAELGIHEPNSKQQRHEY